jgi:DNA mismatch repair protein MutS
VPNDVRLDADGERMMIVTGPNMAGKSTVLRQAALAVIMAQAGSFVPARRARIGIVDRVFTRVGASDNLGEGQSTFMVEMREAAAILRGATRRSLVVLDELGRGTSTYDGLAIAWAIAEHLHDTVGARTLFATHYHELSDLARERPRVGNAHIEAREWGEQVLFMRRLVEGGASRSYGIQVARLAGLPAKVVERAREVLKQLEETDRKAPVHTLIDDLPLFSAARAAEPEVDEVRAALDALRPDDMSPKDALEALYRLKGIAREQS